MKDRIENENTERGVWSAGKKVVFGVLLSVVFGPGGHWHSKRSRSPAFRRSSKRELN